MASALRDLWPLYAVDYTGDVVMAAIMCQYCKTDGLSWRNAEGRWRLYYESGQPHLCRAIRDKLLKAVGKPKQPFWDLMSCPNCFRIIGEYLPCREHGGPTHEEFWNLPALLKWEAKHPKPEPFPPEAEYNYSHPYWDLLDGENPRPRVAKIRVAKQEVMELVP